MIFQQPNFFGCLEPAPDLAAAANDAGALAVAHVDPVSLGVLEAPGDYGCAIAIGEGQAAGNYQSFGGPHYGFIAARSEFMRRMPGRIVGETTDVEGERGYVLTLQTREQHIRREKATSNITTNQTLLALGGLVYLAWLGPAGTAGAGGDLHGPRRVREGAARPSTRVSRSDNVQGVCHPRRTTCATRSIRAARAQGVHPGYALGRDYAGMDDALLVCRHREAHPGRHRPARRGAWPREADLREVAGGPPGVAPAAAHDLPVARDPRASFAASGRRGSPRSPSPSSSGTSPSSRRATSASTPASIRSAPAR